VLSVFKKWGLDATEIGVVTDDGMLRVKNNGVVFAEIPNRALADEAPKYHRPFTKPLRDAPVDGPPIKSKGLTADLQALLSSGDLCSKRWIWQQYDYQVRTNTLAGPGAEAAIVRIKGTETSVAMALDGNGRYCALDPRAGTKLIVAECCRNLSTVGALPIATTNNLNFGNPERPEIMAQIVESIEGLAEACRFADARGGHRWHAAHGLAASATLRETRLVDSPAGRTGPARDGRNGGYSIREGDSRCAVGRAA